MEFVTLWTGMGIATIVCLAVGLGFLLIEMFVPGFGFFGVTGILSLIAALILRITVDPTDSPAAHFFLLLLMELLVVALAISLFLIAVKRGWLDNTFIIEKKSAVPAGITDGTADYSFLIGMKGQTQSALRPAGIAVIEGKRYDVVTEGSFIDKEKEIIVSGVEGVRIVVRNVE